MSHDYACFQANLALALDPAPVDHFRKVFPMRTDVFLVLGQLVLKCLDCISSNAVNFSYATERVHSELKSVHVVAHYHVKRCGRGAFFLIATNMKIVMVFAAVA